MSIDYENKCLTGDVPEIRLLGSNEASEREAPDRIEWSFT